MFTFTNRRSADLKKGVDKLGSAKSNAALVSKLIISLLAHSDADIDDFSSMGIRVNRHPYPIEASCDREKSQIFWDVYQACLFLTGLSEPKRLLWLFLILRQ